MPRLWDLLGGRSRPRLLAVGFSLLLLAWVMSTAPFTAPDEASHYLRAMEIANGQLLGPKAPYIDPGLNPTQLKFIDYDTRLVYVAVGMLPPDVPCYQARAQLHPPCWAATPNGNFPPLPYLLPALALKLSNNQGTGMWLTRAAAALPSLALLLLALALLWDGTVLSVLGLLACLTPMVLFSASIMSSSGPEITGSLALGAAVLRLTRDPERSPPWVYTALAVGGCVSILSGPIGLVFCAAFLLLGLLFLGLNGLRACWNARRRALIRAAIALVIATVLSFIWRHVSGIAPGLFGLHPIRLDLRLGVKQLPGVLKDSLGDFGSQTVPLPLPVYWLGWIFELGLIAAALWLAAWRDKWIVAAATLLCVAFPVAFWAFIDRLTGFGLQGREILPVLMLIPLAAGEAIRRRRPSTLGREGALGRRLLGGTVLAVALFQAYSWWINASTNSGKRGALAFYSHATWSPPLGWIVWMIAALAGFGALVAFAAGEFSGERVPGSLPGAQRSLVQP